MTMLCTVRSTRQPVAWERVFGVVVPATGFPETVVRLAMGASTRRAVERTMVGQAGPLVIHCGPRLINCLQLWQTRGGEGQRILWRGSGRR